MLRAGLRRAMMAALSFIGAAHAHRPAAAHAGDPINQKLTAADKVGLYRQMVRIRRFEQVSLQHYQAGRMGGFLHLYIGQESVAVGTVSVMGPNDHVITAYRDHGHALAVGMGMNECMAELFGKATGCSRGKGGSMHYFAPDKNYWGGHGIVAGQTPLGLGLAYALTRLLVSSFIAVAPLAIVFPMTPDVRVLAATFVFCLFATVVSGLGPALIHYLVRSSVEAEVGGFISSVQLTVSAATLEKLFIVRPSADQTALANELRAVAQYSDGAFLDVTELCHWRSSDPQLVQVESVPGSRGQLSSVKGAVEISAQLMDLTETFTIGP